MKSKGKLYDSLVETIKRFIPEEENAAEWIAKNLKIEKESAYRRLRGNVHFTFEEIVKLSFKLGFSIDSILDIHDTTHALFNLQVLNLSPDYFCSYKDSIDSYTQHFQNMEGTRGQVKIATNSLPYIFILSSPILSKFRLYKWVYQTEKNDPFFLLSDFVLPKEILQSFDSFNQSLQKIPYLTMVMDRNVFTSLIHDINYFYKRRLINDEELESMKKDLFALVDNLEEVTTSGVNKNKKKVDVYLSAIDIEELYVHIKYEDIEFCHLRLFSINSLNSKNLEICRIQEEWIDSLKRFSVMISHSSEIQRFKYLNKQREYIRDMGNEEDNFSF